MKNVIIRLVNHGDILSQAIIMEQGGMIAHAETIMPGGTVIGAYAEHGVIERPLDYDNGVFDLEILVCLTVDDAAADAFHHYLRTVAAKKEPYDFPGLADFVQFLDLHKKHWVYCSALVVDAFRGNGAAPGPRIWFRALPKPAHEVSPVWLQELLYVLPYASILTGRTDPIFLAHISEKTA
jgi:hypothetical protein